MWDISAPHVGQLVRQPGFAVPEGEAWAGHLSWSSVQSPLESWQQGRGQAGWRLTFKVTFLPPTWRLLCGPRGPGMWLNGRPWIQSSIRSPFLSTAAHLSDLATHLVPAPASAHCLKLPEPRGAAMAGSFCPSVLAGPQEGGGLWVPPRPVP